MAGRYQAHLSTKSRAIRILLTGNGGRRSMPCTSSAKIIVIRVNLAAPRRRPLLNFPHRWHVSKLFAERRFDAEPYS